MPAIIRGMSTVYAYRGNHVETEHFASVAVVAGDGRLILSAGDPERMTTLRSTAKPFQALALFDSGAFTRFNVTQEELALACASHQGTPRHVSIVADWLSRLGLGVNDLGCGVHPPSDSATRTALLKAGESASALHNNCSGKHTGMLASALSFGAPTDGYLELGHPVQRAIADVHARLSGTSDPDWVVDGCSAPCAVMPLAGMARMYAALAAPEAAPSDLALGLGAAFDAMRAFPELVAGDGVPDTTVMRALPGVVAKRGADGAYALALRDTVYGPIGVSLKVHDGSDQARTTLLIAVLDALGVTDGATALDPLRSPARRNCRGTNVGRWEAQLRWVAA